MENPFSKILVIALLSFLFLIFIVNVSYGAKGTCEACTVDADCQAGLKCIDDKCRGCPTGDGVVICNPLRACEVSELIESIINFIFVIALAIAPLMIMIAAFYYLTSAGNPRQIETAKNIILYTFIGLLIIFFAKAIISVIKLVTGG